MTSIVKKYQFSERSTRCLAECDPRLQRLAAHAIENGGVDFTVYCGHRNEADQNKAVLEGKSKLRYPHSKHNQFPSLAFDAAPYPIDWDDVDGFKRMARAIMDSAHVLGIQIRWGGDWNCDGDKTTNDDWDKPHFELI